MLTSEQILALFVVAFKAQYQVEHPGFRASTPTPTSVDQINNALGIILPGSFVEFARRCPAYTIIFASIGGDFDNDNHILNVNREFHGDDPHYRVPSWFVVFNTGHDGDCEGFDSRKRSADGEYPIVYWSALGGLDFDNTGWPVFHSFHEHLEHTITYYARNSDKVRAEEIIHGT
jgi:hypothetical protein